jgi:hypothetical protein
MRTSTLIVIASVLACATAQGGDVYKYVDSQGRTHYTDRPMPGAERVSAATQRPPEAAAKTYAQQQSTQNRQLADSNQRIAAQQGDARAREQVAKDLEATRAERCKKAREDYNRSIEARRMYKDGPNGTRTYLTDAEIAASRVEAQKAVESICGPQG